LTSPEGLASDVLAAMLDKVFSRCDIAAFLLRSSERDTAGMADMAAPLLQIARNYDVMFLIENSAGLARQLGADGIHLSDGLDGYDSARRQLGADAIIGIGCGGSRHQAMLAGEAGCDYVAFGARSTAVATTGTFAEDREIARWWAELFEIPCVLMPASLDDAADPGCEFLSPPPSFWAGSDGPARTLGDLEAKLRAERQAA